MVFDCGPLGFGKMAAHGHADALSITLSVNGQPVLMDSGTYMYLGAGSERNYFRGTRAHNTITIDGLDQSEILGPFQWGRRARCTIDDVKESADSVRIQAFHDGYRHIKVKHGRRIESQAGAWLVKDFISGIGSHQIDAYFHIAHCEMIRHTNSIKCNFSSFGIEFDFSQNEFLNNENIILTTAWHSERFGTRDHHPVIKVSCKRSLPFELITKISVYE